MKVNCSSCGAANNIADDKVKGRRVKVRCKSCGTRLVVDATSDVAKTIAASEVSKSSPPAATGQKPGASLPPPRTSVAPKPATAAAAPLGRAGTLKPVVAPVRTAPGAFARPGAAAARLDDAESPWWVNVGESDEQNMTVAEIVAGWKSGTISEDAYVWREGWDDWLPVLEVAELKAAIDAGAKEERAAAAATPKPMTPSVAPRAPAAFPPAGTKELDELDVDVDAGELEATPIAPPESSGQLSLQALKAEMQPPAAKKIEPKRPKSLDEILGLGSTATTPAPLLAFGTADLATAPAPPPPKPEPVVIASIPAPPATGVRRTLPVLLAMFAAMVIGGLAVAVIMLMNRQETAKNEKTDAGVSAAAATKEAAAPAASTQKTEEEKAPGAEAADAGAAAAKTEAAKPVTGGQTQKSAKATASRDTSSAKSSTSTSTKNTDEKSASTTKTEPPVKVKDKPSDGLATFDTRAAAAALSTVASQCTACRRLDGPKGSGRALVTFAPSGRVTGVQITGGSFQGTKVGSCVAGVFRRAKVPSFSGGAVTVAKSFTIPQ
jgi:predicted Zn finger-like uncharacterized protein